MNKMQLLEYVMVRLYCNGTTSKEATIILQDKMGYTLKDMEQVDKEIVTPNWPADHTKKQSLEYCSKKIMEYEMQ